MSSNFARGFLVFLLCATAIPAWGRSHDPGSVKIRGASYPVAEEEGMVVVTVRRHRGSSGQVSVDYATHAGSAVDGEDYEGTAGTLVWEDGDSDDRTFEVVVLDDDLEEGLETFGVTLSNAAGGVEIGQPASAVVRIKPSDRAHDGEDSDSADSDSADSEDSDSEDSDSADSDSADSEDSDGADSDSEDSDGADSDSDGADSDSDGDGGLIKFTSVAFPAFESSGEASFVVERDGGNKGEVRVDYATIDGSATEGLDYLAAAGTLIWADGEDGSKSVPVTLVDDAESEPLETVTVVLTHARGGRLGVRDVASIVIVDDDGGDGVCVPDGETLCLGDGRFQLTGTWRDFDGNEGPMHMVPASDDSGLAWFFDEGNVELLIKVLRGCPINGHYWVFFAATTNLGFTLEVTDLATGATRTYQNDLGVVPLATTDVTAFATCS